MSFCLVCSKPNKLERNETCSRSCGGILRWSRNPMNADQIRKMAVAANRSKRPREMKERILKECQALGIEYNPIVAKLYVRAYNRGYLSGYATREKRYRKLSTTLSQAS